MLGKCHLCHLVLIMLQPLVNIENPDFMGELRKGLVVPKVCAAVNISSEVVWKRTRVSMQSVVECKIR